MMFLYFLLLNWLLPSIAPTRFNLYNTDGNLDINHLYVNCLHYYNRHALQMTEKTEYCLGPISNNYLLSDDFLNIHSRKYTFDELRQLNVTTNQLLSWSATIDLAEQYQHYIDHQNDSSASEIFFNCTKPWFGPRCQFSFDTSKMYSFQSFVQDMSKWKETIPYDYPYIITNLPCYIHLKCDRGGSSMCLDWREVCDGRIDCIDGGADEAQCSDLEVNECDENEYRCHNGLCIPKEFLNDFGIECLDRSDLMDESFFRATGGLFYVFNYEEHSCRPGPKQFACGDGECVADFDTCTNKRHFMLIESISAQGNLSYTCWITMICLTKIRDRVNEISCDQFLRSSDFNTYLQTCEDLIQFPTVPVLFGHVRFLYRSKKASDLDIDLPLIPDYLCYDHQLCEFLTPTYHYGSYSCRRSYEFDIHWNVRLKRWASLIHLVESYFRKCLTRYNNNNKNYSHPSLYHCKNTSKYISKHRIVDNVSDCYLNDDEEKFELSCLVPDVLRFRCGNENKCYSSWIPQDICPLSYLRYFDEIEFRDICDRHNHMFPLIIDGRNHTDETDCEQWPCNNFYTRCDGFWSCHYGEDEENCTEPICPSRFLPCISPYNYTLTCLPANQVGDEYIDCFGAIDELQYCRSRSINLGSYPGFRCKDPNLCVSWNHVCDKSRGCVLGYDEAFCEDHRENGYNMTIVDGINVKKFIGLIQKNLKIIEFSLATSLAYPPSESRRHERITRRSIQQQSISNVITDESDNLAWLWRCNHGLYVRHWLGGNNFSYKCFCPSNYYGDICQYQNQRVSLTVQLRVINMITVYAIVITLIDDKDDRQEINSYHQYTSISAIECQQNFNAYLTYATRPKNNLTNYSVRVDVFNKTNLRYLASWHFTIPFSFLPVNRMAVVLYAPGQPVPSPNDCPLTCYNGQCMKYMNKEKFFCRCYTNWSGAQCNIPIRCSDCSNDSICIGMIHNRSMCVCPLYKGGPRCLLTLSCDPEISCYNNGQCLPLDDNMHELSFDCMCLKEFNGLACMAPHPKIEISFHNITVSPLLFIYTFAVRSGKVQYRPTVQKLTMFQRTISFYLPGFFRMVFVKTDDNYYLALLQHDDQYNISTSIDSNRRCTSVIELLSAKLRAEPEIRRVKYYHAICQTHPQVICFVDEHYMCVCTLEHHANCMRFDSTPPKCRDKFYCQNGGNCLQDDLKCPTAIFCNCIDCFFGDRCQYEAKGIGLTLDDILRYEIRPNTTIHDQKSIIKWGSAMTMVLFVLGLINSVLSILTFCTKKSRDIGCGIYLLVSSITSLLTITIFTVKFWFLILTHINPSISYSVLRGICISFEFILKVSLYTDNWLNACVALERAMTVYKGVNFNKMLSKRFARWVIVILPLCIIVSTLHEPFYRDLYEDKEENRFWCVFNYSPSIQMYNKIISLFHFVSPFCINLFSALYIIFAGARRQKIVHKRLPYKQYLNEQFKEHKNLIISPTILIVLSLPSLIFSFAYGCVKLSHNAWLYFLGYLASFLPSGSIFFVFVLPSNFYKEQLKEMIKFGRK